MSLRPNTFPNLFPSRLPSVDDITVHQSSNLKSSNKARNTGFSPSPPPASPQSPLTRPPKYVQMCPKSSLTSPRPHVRPSSSMSSHTDCCNNILIDLPPVLPIPIRLLRHQSDPDRMQSQSSLTAAYNSSTPQHDRQNLKWMSTFQPFNFALPKHVMSIMNWSVFQIYIPKNHDSRL